VISSYIHAYDKDSVSFELALAHFVKKRYRTFIYFFRCEYSKGKVFEVKLSRTQMLMHHCSADIAKLYPLLDGAEVNGVVLNGIKLRNPNQYDYQVRTEMLGVCVSNTLEKDRGTKFRSVSITFFDEFTKRADLDLTFSIAREFLV